MAVTAAQAKTATHGVAAAAPGAGSALKRMTIPAGTRIFLQGDQADAAYIIESGLVELLHDQGDDSTVIGLLGRGEIFGEMGLIDKQPRSVTARTVQPTVLAVVSAEAFEAYMQRTPPFVRKVLEVMSIRLRRQNRIAANNATIIR
ncbi:MAG: Crp/Fnr family transcriptional regulator [Rhodospirillales bacterium]|nr:Crp/Fnr family transcriptional regulator [Rhodospirillales bacterium]